MSNVSTDFIKINNEYVKFYATTNTALPDILRNTGALIVVQDNDRIDELEEPIRSLYIAKNFIAEGHGFSAYTVRDYFDELGKQVTWTDKNGTPYSERQLTYILNALQYGINTNAENMKQYVLTNGGKITNTFIDAFVPYGNESYLLQSVYLTNILKPAEYNKAVIKNVFSYITYEYTPLEENSGEVYTSYATNIDAIDFNNETMHREIIYDVPRGAHIKSAYLYMESENNDTTGFTAVSESNNSNQIPQADKSKFVSDISVDDYNDDREIPIDDERTNSLMNSLYFNAHNRGTDLSESLKPYPWMPDDVPYYSYENAIAPYTVEVGYVKCNIYDVIKYDISGRFRRTSINPTTINVNNSRIYSCDDSHNSAYAVIDCSIADDNNKYLSFSVPENYEVLHVSQTRKYSRTNIPLSYYEYNITGDVYELNRNTSQVMSYHYHTCKDYYCRCRNYYVNNSLKPTDTIHISLRKNEGFTENLMYRTNSVNTNVNSNVSKYFLQDSEYNSNHWMSPAELSVIQNEI